MRTVKNKSRGTLGLVVSISLHVLFFAGCLLLDTSNISSGNEKSSNVNEISQIQHTTVLAENKS